MLRRFWAFIEGHVRIRFMFDRRFGQRRPIELFFNKYLAGQPYLCRSVDLSPGGVLAFTFSEPAHELESFPLELRLPRAEQSLWVWARGVWRSEGRQAIEFLGLAAEDRTTLNGFLAALA